MAIYADPKPRKPIRNRAYIEWIMTKPCIFCGKPALEPHHDRKGHGDGQGSMSRKSDDYRVIKTCPECHRALHGTDKSRLKWMWDKVNREDIYLDTLNNLIEWISRGMK